MDYREKINILRKEIKEKQNELYETILEEKRAPRCTAVHSPTDYRCTLARGHTGAHEHWHRADYDALELWEHWN